MEKVLFFSGVMVLGSKVFDSFTGVFFPVVFFPFPCCPDFSFVSFPFSGFLFWGLESDLDSEEEGEGWLILVRFLDVPISVDSEEGGLWLCLPDELPPPLFFVLTVFFVKSFFPESEESLLEAVLFSSVVKGHLLFLACRSTVCLGVWLVFCCLPPFFFVLPVFFVKLISRSESELSES